MLDFSREAQLLKPVERFLKNKRFTRLHTEVGFYQHSIDLFAYSKKLNETVSVELKLKNWKKALQQALVYQLCSDYVYIAMPKKFINEKLIEKTSQFGIGFIAVYPSGFCRSLLAPQQSIVVKKKYRFRFIEKSRKKEFI